MKRSPMIVAGAMLATVAALGPKPVAIANVEHHTAPRVFVSPSRGLTGGDTVEVVAFGLPRTTDVRVVQCDTFGNPETVCPDLAVVSTSRRGTLKVSVQLADPIIATEPAGDGRAVYCRADQCRIGIVAVPTETDEFVALAESAPLFFRGSPATVSVQPSTGLQARQWVKVSGTARGASGQLVRIVEQACYRIVQETGCYAALEPRYALVRPDGSFSTYYLVHRHLPNFDAPVDCTAGFDILGECVISASVLDHNGEPDDSFGIARWGEPMAPLQFFADSEPSSDATSSDVNATDGAPGTQPGG